MSLKKIRKKKQVPTPAAGPRPGGSAIQITEKPGELTVHFPDGPPERPAHVYAADAANLVERVGQISLVFVELDPLLQIPTTAVSVHYSRDSFLRSLDRSAAFFDTLSQWIRAQFGPEPCATPSAASTTPLQKSHSERVTFERIAFREGDAEIEFYSISPLRMHDSRQLLRPVDGCVRPCLTVVLPSLVLYSLLLEAYQRFGKKGA